MNHQGILLGALPCIFLGMAASAQQAVPSPASIAVPAADAPLQQRIQALVERVKKELVYLPGGTFEMGDWGNEEGLPYDIKKDSKPLHQVTLSGFYMMAYKVTYEDFDLFTDAVGEVRVAQDNYGRKFRAPRKPAGVNWYGAKAYCNWLAKLTGWQFDLPTEAQWEYAARSGGKRLLFATDTGVIEKNRNYPLDAEGLISPEIGKYPPNPAGIYGMIDHAASEWVNDWYDPEYYQASPKLDPKGPSFGQPVDPKHPEYGAAKVVRGHSSPGNNPIFGGFVFSRGADEPKEVRNVRISRLPGYSHWPESQFRCAAISG